MMHSALFAALCLLAAVPASASDPRVVAYVTGWETRPPDIDATKLTHINFAFGRIEELSQDSGDALLDAIVTGLRR